jgi:transposase-like protein
MLSSFEEAGEQLFTFLRYPVSQWKALRTTNALERINEEFRRRLGVEVDRTRCILQSLVGTIESEAVEVHHHRPAVYSLLTSF